MRLLARIVAVAGLVVAGGLTLPGGAAQAAACPNTTGVTVVVDYGSSSSTYCAPDASTAGAVLDAVTDVAYVPMYGNGVICKINGVPANQTCRRMPPASAYWAFFHAERGGSWIYSSSGVADYNPAPGSVIGFAFGSGGAPSSAPPAAIAPKPSPKPSPSSSSSSSSSKPPSPKPKPSPTSGFPTPSTARGSASTLPDGAATRAPGATSSSVTGSATTTASGARTSSTPPTGETAATGPTAAGGPSSDSTDGGGLTAAAASGEGGGSGTPTTLLAGLGLVGLVGAGAAYLTIRRRAHP